LNTVIGTANQWPAKDERGGLKGITRFRLTLAIFGSIASLFSGHPSGTWSQGFIVGNTPGEQHACESHGI